MRRNLEPANLIKLLFQYHACETTFIISPITRKEILKFKNGAQKIGLPIGLAN
jgi:hypothetical protein